MVMKMITKEKGLNIDKIKQISKIKNEPKWMLDFRLKSFEEFKNLPNPKFGPELKIDFDDINYYKRLSDEVFNNWDNVPDKARKTFCKLGLPKAENKYLDGIGAQYDSEVIYHNMIKELEEKNVIFLDTDTALKKHPELFKKYSYAFILKSSIQIGSSFIVEIFLISSIVNFI